MKADFLIKAFIIAAIFAAAMIFLGATKLHAEDLIVSLAPVSEAMSSQALSPSELATIDALVPPAWLLEVMHKIESVPVIGPVAIDVFKWLGVVAAVMTALVTCLLSITRALVFAGRIQGMAPLMAWAMKLEKGKVMYWLKYFSVYNAKKE